MHVRRRHYQKSKTRISNILCSRDPFAIEYAIDLSDEQRTSAPQLKSMKPSCPVISSVDVQVRPQTKSTLISSISNVNVKCGAWGPASTPGTLVSIMEQSLDTKSASTWILQATEDWAKLSHPHVLTLYGVCLENGSPLLICEHAAHGSFETFFANGANRNVFWKCFCEASAGLLHMKSKNMAHGDLHLSSLFVGADGKAKISAFRLASCSFPDTPDVSALGGCIADAWTIGAPHSTEGLGEAANEGSMRLRPTDMSDQGWELIQKMCHRDPMYRIPMEQVFECLQALMRTESQASPEETIKHGCDFKVSHTDIYCENCGARISLSTDHT